MVTHVTRQINFGRKNRNEGEYNHILNLLTLSTRKTDIEVKVSDFRIAI